MAPPRKHPRVADPLLDRLGRRVAHLRAERGVSPQDLAARAGMSAQYLWRVEDGRQNLSFRNVARLARALDVTLSELLVGVEAAEVDLDNRSYSRKSE